MNSLVGRFSLQNVGQFETKILIKLCKLYLMASNNEIFDGIATTRISSTPELSAFIFRKQKKKLPEIGGWVHCSSQQRDLLDQESLLATSCPIVRVSQKVATSIGKLYYVQCTILLWRTSIAPAFHLTNILISQDEAKVMIISNSSVKWHYYWILWKLHV